MATSKYKILKTQLLYARIVLSLKKGNEEAFLECQKCLDLGVGFHRCINQYVIYMF